MTSERDTKQIVDLAFQPIRCRPNSGDTPDARAVVCVDFQTDAVIQINREQVVHNLERPRAALGIVNTRDVRKIIEARLFILFEKLADLHDPFTIHTHGELTEKLERIAYSP